MHLGVETDTLDLQGETVAESAGWEEVTPDHLEEALDRFRGEILQLPPAYSAKKVGGEAAHRRARRGEAVELEPVTVHIRELVLEGVELPRVRFRVTCSSGTYIRALARDLGRDLGVGAHLTALRRTRVGPFSVEGAVSGDFPGDISDAAWLTPLQALEGWPVIRVDADQARRIGHGQRLPVDAPDAEEVAVALQGELLAVGAVRAGVLHPSRVFPHVLEARV
jgi:tRNA pseudouridine55 synthase